jgi:putative membrane protein
MINNFNDHAANERTYLAWVRTGITISVFGFVVEKFDLFLSQLPRLAEKNAVELTSNYDIRVLSVVLVVVGIGVILLSTWHFVRTRRAIEAADRVAYQDLLPAYTLSAMLSAAGVILLLALLRLL